MKEVSLDPIKGIIGFTQMKYTEMCASFKDYWVMFIVYIAPEILTNVIELHRIVSWLKSWSKV